MTENKSLAAWRLRGTGGQDDKGTWKNLGDGGYIHYVDCGVGFMGAYIRQNLQTVHFKYV